MSSLHSALLEINQKKQQLTSMLNAAKEEQAGKNFFHYDPGLSVYINMLKAQLNILDWVSNLIQT